MVYQCEKCGSALPAGAQACPNCGDNFDEVVPPDAEVPRRGWQAKSEEPPGPRAPVASAFPGTRPEADTETPLEPHPSRGGQDSSDRDHSGRDYWQSKRLQAKGVAGRILEHPFLEHPFGRRLKRRPLLALVGLLPVVLVLIALIRPHTASYVFDQHPMYQANMASFTDVARSHTIDYVWPYEGHEDRLQALYHPNSFGGGSSQLPSKRDLNDAAAADRLGFCAIRYRSGFSPDDAMKCQVYVTFEGSSDTGYDGPELNPTRDAAIEGQLDRVR